MLTLKRRPTHKQSAFISQICLGKMLPSFSRESEGIGVLKTVYIEYKDVIHNEDGNRIRKDNGLVNMTVISSIAINSGRKYGPWSMRERIAWPLVLILKRRSKFLEFNDPALGGFEILEELKA